MQITLKHAIYSVLLISAIFGVLDVFFIGLTADTDGFMHQGLLIWHRQGFYTNFIQVNAPFNIILDAPLAALSVYAHLPPAMVLHGFAALLCIAGITSLNHALRLHNLARNDRKIWVAASAFLLFVPPTLFAVFADREHLLFALGLPWIIQMLLRLRPLPYTCLLFGIGCCMRPYDVVLFGALALTAGPGWSLFQRLFSYSSLIIGAVLCVYAVSVVIFFPAYITDIMPIASITYSAAQVPFQVKLVNALQWGIVTFLLFFKFIRTADDRMAWGGFCLGLYILFFVSSGWIYSVYIIMPVPLVLVCAACWYSPYKEKFPARYDEPFISCLVLAIVFALSAAAAVEDVKETGKRGVSVHSHTHMLPAGLVTSLREAAGKQFILLSAQLWNIDIEPLGGKPESVFAFDDLWPVHWLYKHPQDPNFNRILHFTTDLLVSDMNNYPEASIIVDASPKAWPRPGTPIMEYLSQDPAVQADFKLYSKVNTFDFCVEGTISSMCRFEIWKRSK